MSKIINNLWLGDIYDAHNINFLKKNKISVIVNCTKDLDFPHFYQCYKYRVPVHDDLTFKEINSMSKYIKDVVHIIDNHIKKNHNVFVHCMAGIQRSPIVVLSYLYFKNNNNNPITYVNYMKKRRYIVFTPYMNFKQSFEKAFNIKINNKLIPEIELL